MSLSEPYLGSLRRYGAAIAPRIVARARKLKKRPLAAVVLGAALIAAQALHEHRAERYGARERALRPALGDWHLAFEADKARLKAERRAAKAAVANVASQLAAIQTRIVELDALARGVLENTEPASNDIDFEEEPALGGPEEASDSPVRPLRLERAVDLLAAQLTDRGRQLHVLEDLLEWREHLSAVRPEGRPVAGGYVSSGFGERIDPFTGRKQQHVGMDFAARRGTNVVAVADGVVTWTGPRGGYGRLIEIDHGNGRVTRYGHNAEILVHIGQVVRRGQPIAKLGSSGRATGPNLHFEVRENGKAVDPRPFVNGQGKVSARRSAERKTRAKAGLPGQVAEAEAHRKGQGRQVAALVVKPDA